jgi:predicted DNA-binding transcriptional regulator AlpA
VSETSSTSNLDRLLPLREVLVLVPVNRTTLWRMCHAADTRKRFPEAVRIGVRRLAWRSSDVQAWIGRQADASRGGR